MTLSEKKCTCEIKSMQKWYKNVKQHYIKEEEIKKACTQFKSAID